ncbi:S41 family peptidase [Winogradskyella jejuensis]|uniref:Peptidase family S41 n=1 Tax=Winogradskyella jejuensis TaxID=1089305 RepID=A0A1M5SZD5_9FLAO|nr:S41 family peptidase [Winogradskyella jejuensis]SHH43836.1 Peptidase family S41 [Winogradskyella jejuensis]
MNQKFKLLLLTITVAFFATSCFEDQDDNLVLTADVKDFVWKGMNEFYLYGEDVPDLRNTRFGINGGDNRYESTPEYLEYLNGFSSPEALFDALVFDAGNTDRFSQIFPDLFAAIDLLNGTNETNGLRRLFGFELNGSFYVRVGLVLNGSNADLAGVRRNMVISGVNGTTLTAENANSLLSQNTITLNFADYDDNGTEELDDDTATPNGQSITVSREQFTDNPVHRVEVIQEGNETIGYLMYNGFRNNFETELNAAFAQLSAANVEHLVIDLRYNGGGAIVTAARLASMITGQFDGQVLAKTVNGPNRQEDNTDFTFTNSIDGGAAINSLGLDKVYVITTSNSASASELIINSLNPYIQVIQVGTTTTGKTTSNRLVFDSPDFGTSSVTSAHIYALFPLVGNVTNRDDVSVPSTGLVPDIELAESSANFGTLGDPEEPLLKRAIEDITGAGRFANFSNNTGPSELKSIGAEEPFFGYMYE